ncbi:helix-turn-helix transcriptional regulator [Enterococcus devriesei]|uniref:helix-turn-helix transcriptional regulator n=1 Tax=Enterococcus devriesei TaxID=319970 RepID=UPI001C0FFC78|nr:helix-turn-helix transcriptional regulator [Enterococcus devriesei]MBU5363838.1 helix-turn-helix domain-containing protein [Enterococcus devriesei]MDT2822090.1 helix-turn-helix transcriptional regulator [Enterococcus devriesei]
MKISKKIKEERLSKQWTQEQLAKEILVSKRTITNWETGKTIPDIESVIRLAKLFQLSLDDLMLEDSAVVKEIQRKEKIAKLTGIYYIGPVLTGIILVVMMYLPNPNSEWMLGLIAVASMSNLLPLYYFKEKLGFLKGKPSKVQRELKQIKIISVCMIVLLSLFIVSLYVM